MSSTPGQGSRLQDELSSLRLDREPSYARRPRWPWVLLVLLIGLGAGGWWLRKQAAERPVEVTLVQASVIRPDQGQSLGTMLSASGYLVPRRKAVVSSKIQGRLAKLNVEEGSFVHQGDVIATLESSDLEAQVRRMDAAIQRMEAELSEYHRQLNIAERLTAEGVSSVDARDAARSRVRLSEASLGQARADLGLAQAQLENTIIHAPFTGTVVKKMAEVGESVAPIPPGVNISTASGAVVALADFSTLEVEADVAEANVARLAADQPAEVIVEAFPDKIYKGLLRQVIPTADRTKATVQVKVTIVDKDKLLKPEMSARVNFLQRQQRQAANAPAQAPVVTVPTEAVVERNGSTFVYEVQEGRAHRREVKTGTKLVGRTVITQGLAGTETLIANPPESLKDGDPVKSKS